MDDAILTRLAEEELLREAKRGEARAAVHGVMGWLKDKTPRTNKRFLSNTISNALQHNHRQRNVGTVREEASSYQNKEKLKHKEQTGSYALKKKDEKKIKSRCKHEKLRSQHNQDSDSDDLSDRERSEHHNPKHKHRKLHE